MTDYNTRQRHNWLQKKHAGRIRDALINAALVIGLIAVCLMAGCGQIDRNLATWIGTPAEICVDGVLYLQFTSGASVKYDQAGNVATCGK